MTHFLFSYSAWPWTPPSYELNDTGYGYKIGEEKINHLFYMDDLKLYGKNDKELGGLLLQ